MKNEGSEVTRLRTGWASLLARASAATLLFLAVSGLAVTFAPFHAATQWTLIVHTLVGVVTLLPIAWYYVIHFLDYKHYKMSHVVLLGYVGLVALAVCTISGVVVTWQGLLGTSMSPVWRQVHLITTFVTLAATLPHIVFSVVHMRRRHEQRPVSAFAWQSTIAAGVILLLTLVGLPRI